MSAFLLSIPVRFGDCDPAGILYYPRYFDLFHQAMEAWFGEGLGLPYDDFIRQRRLGLPAVRAEADYRRPTTFGETVDVALTVAEIGRSSVVLEYAVLVDEPDPRAVGRTVNVLMDLDPGSPRHLRAVPFPDDVRAALEAFQQGS